MTEKLQKQNNNSKQFTIEYCNYEQTLTTTDKIHGSIISEMF